MTNTHGCTLTSRLRPPFLGIKLQLLQAFHINLQEKPINLNLLLMIETNVATWQWLIQAMHAPSAYGICDSRLPSLLHSDNLSRCGHHERFSTAHRQSLWGLRFQILMNYSCMMWLFLHEIWYSGAPFYLFFIHNDLIHNYPRLQLLRITFILFPMVQSVLEASCHAHIVRWWLSHNMVLMGVVIYLLLLHEVL